MDGCGLLNCYNPMSSDLRRKLIWSMMIVLLIYIVFILFGDVQKLVRELQAWPWILLPIVIGLTLVNYVLRLFKWHWYLQLLDVPISRYDSGRVFGVGMLMVMTPGKAGEFLKSYMVRNITGVPMGVTAPVVLAERITDGIAMLLIASAGLVAFPNPLARTIAAAVFCGFLIFVGVIQSRTLSMRLLKFGESLPVVKKLAGSLYEFYESSYTIFRPRNLLISLTIGVISWLAEAIAYFVVLYGFGIPFTMTNIMIALFIFSISVVIGAVFATPGGVGGVEGSLIALSMQLLNVMLPIATAAALLIRFCTLWLGVFIGIASFFLWSDLLAGSENVEEDDPHKPHSQADSELTDNEALVGD